MLRLALASLFLTLSDVVAGEELEGGTVCLGNNLAKPYDEHTERLFLKIDDSAPIYFTRPYTGPRVVAKDLDIYGDHVVQVYFGGQEAQSWRLNFSKLKTHDVLVWRGEGAWRMEATDSSVCK